MSLISIFSALIASAVVPVIVAAAPLDSIVIWTTNQDPNVVVPSTATIQMDENVSPTSSSAVLARIVPSGDNAAFATVTVDDNVHFNVLDSAGVGIFLEAKVLFDYESGDTFFSPIITVNVNGNVLTRALPIKINPINDNSATTPDTITVNTTETITVTVDLNNINGKSVVFDADLPAAANRWEVCQIDQPKYGYVDTSDTNWKHGVFKYIPRHAGIEQTDDYFGYYLYDWTTYGGYFNGNRQINPSYVHIYRANVNDEPPVGRRDTFYIPQCADTTIVEPGVLANDTDPDNLGGDSAYLVAGDTTTHGSIYLYRDGGFHYSNSGSKDTVDSFAYQVFDGAFWSDTTWVTLKIKPTLMDYQLNTGIVSLSKFYSTKKTYGDTGVIIMIKPFIPKLALPTISISAKIYDPLGNIVKNLTNADSDSLVNNGITCHYFVWDARNENGRRVGAGFYLAVVNFNYAIPDTRDPSIYYTREESSKIMLRVVGGN